MYQITNSIPMAKADCYLTRELLLSLGAENLKALREQADYAQHHALELVEGELVERFAFGHGGQRYAMDESEATGMLLIESEAQLKLFDDLIPRAEVETVPYLPMFRPDIWFMPGDDVMAFMRPVSDTYPEYRGKFVAGKVAHKWNGSLIVQLTRTVGVTRADEVGHFSNHAINDSVWGKKSYEVLKEWEWHYMRKHPTFTITWARIIAATEPGRASEYIYNVLGDLLAFRDGAI